MNYLTASATALIVLMILLVVYRNNNGKSNLRKPSRGLASDDNEEFKDMLMRKGEIKLSKKYKIDISSWLVITPKVSKIIGTGENSVIEIYPNEEYSIQLFERLENIEIMNINIQIKSSDGTEIVHTKNGITREIVNSTLNGFHVSVNKFIIIHVRNGTSFFISDSIYNSYLNDVGIMFTEMKINFRGDTYYQNFSLISNKVENDNRIVYNGIYLKGKKLTVKDVYSSVTTGLMFRNIKNLDLNYVVFDVEILYFNWRDTSTISLLVYNSTEGLTLNNVMIIVRRSFIFKEVSPWKFNFYLACLVFKTYEKLTINHCLIDIHFGEIDFDYYKAESENDYSRKEFLLTGILGHNYGINVLTNYLQIKYYFKNDYISKKNSVCQYFPPFKITTCKIIIVPTFLSWDNGGGGVFNLRNSYFYVDRDDNVNVDVQFIHQLPNSVYCYDSYFISNDIVSYDGTYSLVTGVVDDIYPSMRLIGYSKSGSIIYDPNIPYYDYESNNINYEIFEKLKPSYDNIEIETLTPTATSPTATSPTATSPTATSPTATIATPTKPSTTTNIANLNHSNKNGNSNLLIVVIVQSVIIIGYISWKIFCYYKPRLLENQKMSHVLLNNTEHDCDECKEALIVNKNNNLI